jgi:branched-chain amino acid transport system substrate-binding protein
VIVAINAVLAAGVPVAILTPSATGVQLTGQADRLDPGDELGLLWRTAPSDVLQAAVLADIVAEELAAIDPATVAVIYQDDPYGQSLESTLRDALETALPDAVVKAEKLDIADLEGSAADAAASAAGESPDAVVVLAGRADRALAVLQAAADQAALVDLPFFLSDGAKDSSILFESDDAGVDAILQRALGTAPFNPVDGSFFDALENDFDVDASQFGFVAHAYDAAYVAALGLAYAARPDGRYDGRGVVEGFARLASGPAV